MAESISSSFIQRLTRGDLSSKELKLTLFGVAGSAVATAIVHRLIKKGKSDDAKMLQVPEQEVVKNSEVSSEEFLKVMKAYGEKFNNSKVFEKVFPRVFTSNQDFEGVCTELKYAQKNDAHAISKALSDPIYDLLDRGGKRWRPVFCILIAEAYGKTFDDVMEIAGACEFIHNGSLVIDDIEDQSQTRRDKPCVHLIHGLDVSINAGCLMYFAPFVMLKKSGKFTNTQLEKFAKIIFEEMVNIHFGQAWDIFWHNSHKFDKLPDEENYLQMTAHKTGVLARMCAKLTGEAIGLNPDYTQRLANYGEKIGISFQIQDDILNLVGQDYIKTKGYSGEDIHEGKKTIIVIHCLRAADDKDRDRLLEIIQLKTTDKNLIEEAINLLKKYDSINYARGVADRLVEEAWNEVKDILPPRKAKWYIKALSEFFVKRNI